MITNKDIRVENGSLILNGDPYPLDGQSPKAIMQIVKDNSDTTPTDESTNPVTSGGIFNAISDHIKCGVLKIENQTIAANTHTNLSYIPVTLPSTTIGLSVMGTPNSAWVFANVISFEKTNISLGVFNSNPNEITGDFKILYFYK